MNIVIEATENADGSWHICRDKQWVTTCPCLGSAIRMAREVGRVIHDETGAGVLVVMVCPVGTTVLAKHAMAADMQCMAAGLLASQDRATTSFVEEQIETRHSGRRHGLDFSALEPSEKLTRRR